MKRFIWFLIVLGAGYAVYRYYPEIERMARERTRAAAPAPAKAPTEIPTVLPGTQPARSTPPAPKAGAEEDPAIVAKYPLPAFKSIEELTGNWKAIPTSAFPREVELRSDLVCDLGQAGSATFPKGAKAWAVSADNGVITLAPNSTNSRLRGKLPVEGTNIQDVLTGVYDKFKARKTAEVVALRKKAARQQAAGPALADSLGGSGGDAPAKVLPQIGPKPSQTGDATVPAMVASMTSGQVTEIKPQEIASWGPVRYQEVDGQPYWVGSVRYTAKTIFGEFPTEALALMRGGRVVKWIYAGSGEPVP